MVSVVLFLTSSKGYCDGVAAPTGSASAVKDIPAGADKIVAVKEGDKVPFTGQLFEPGTALRWSNWLLQYKLRLDTSSELQASMAKADAELADRRVAIEVEKQTVVVTDYKAQVAVRDAQILKLSDPPFYKSVWFGFVIGTVVTGVVAGFGAYAATR